MYYVEGWMEDITVLNRYHSVYVIKRKAIKKLDLIKLGDVSLRVKWEDKYFAIKLDSKYIAGDLDTVIVSNSDDDDTYTLDWLANQFGFAEVIIDTSNRSDWILKLSENDDDDIYWHVVFSDENLPEIDKLFMLEEE